MQQVVKHLVSEPTDTLPAPALPLSGPVAPSERVGSIDVIRGFAVLGILTMNIINFALPATARLNPTIAGGFTGLNFVVWIVGYFCFDEKMITLFSMLFGAGLLLMTERAERRGGQAAKLFYRRSGILLLIGLLHAYLLYEGDILFTYALCGMLVYPLRRQSPRTHLLLGLLLLLPALLLTQSFAALIGQAREATVRVEAAQTHGEAPSKSDQDLAAIWENICQGFYPSPTDLAKLTRIYGEGSYLEIARARAPEAFGTQTQIFLLSLGWTVAGRMLLGMALLQLGIFSARRSRRYYLRMMLLGYGLGWPLVALGAIGLLRHHFDVVYLFGVGLQYNNFGSILVALGHVGVVISIYQAGGLTWLTSRLAAVGRMALSNYLLQSILCTTLFYGYGFGLYGKFDRAQLVGVMVAIWIFQLWLSTLWLKHYRFGPVEWLWRSLTYGRVQPMRMAPSRSFRTCTPEK